MISKGRINMFDSLFLFTLCMCAALQSSANNSVFFGVSAVKHIGVILLGPCHHTAEAWYFVL